ncbi:MAG TPA: DUF4424 family protein [Xanthobacteraceae bacterium]|nr:DUF4424 family protein [Xanthobacteraceae bacterium]
MFPIRHLLNFAAGAACLSVVPIGDTHANDTLAVMGAGGLQFERTDELRMVREDLFLSPGEVRVAYVFRNLTDHEVRATAVFPMPDIDVGLMSETPHEFHRSAHDGDIFDFHAEVDGTAIAPTFEARAFHGADDVTALLIEHHVPLVNTQLDYPSADAIRALTAAGLIAAADDLHHPRWIVKPAYHWVQVFPGRRDIRVAHRYKPVLGGGRWGGKMDAHPRDELSGSYCPDEAFTTAFNKLPSDDLQVRWLEYRLLNGADWAGPIGHFRLELDKANANLVSLCPIPGLNLTKRGRTFVAEANEYTPTKDIRVLFVYSLCSNQSRD